MKNLRIKKIYNLILLISFVISIFILNSNLLQAQTNDPNSNKNSSTESKQSSQSIDNSADNTNSSSPEGSTGSETGLVKCGVSRDCTICDIFILVRDIFNFALGLLAALAVLSIVIGGFYVVTSAGNSGRVSEGYSIITNAVIGLLLVMASFLLFSFVLVALGFQSANFSAIFDFQDGQIFSVKCDNASAFNDRGTGGGGVPTTPQPGSVGKCGSNKCADRYADEIKKGADQHGIDPKIIQALIDTENADGTNCNPNAVRNESNGTLSCGILQLNTGGVASDCGITCEQAKNVETAVACAAKELKRSGGSNICSAANRWNPGACASGCRDIKYTYCSRAQSHYNFYSQCSSQRPRSPSTSETTQ